MAGDTIPLFNLKTMSGVFAGTRTAFFQRIQIEAVDRPTATKQWLQLAWYDDPALCAAYVIQPGRAIDYAQPLFQLSDPLQGDFNQQLQRALAANQQRMVSCGSCGFWQGGAVVTPDQLPVGDCHWHSLSAADKPLPALLVMQSALALHCSQWQPGDEVVEAITQPARKALAPMRKVAESAEIRLHIWQRLYKRFDRWRFAGKPRDWATLFLERSGVGAGTEPCFVCQGRLANLGALAVATPEGDKETFSIWRCRNCYTLYLNDWVDRWERLDNLETEETYYRIAPAEAKDLLTVIYGVVGGEHPHRRQERHQERTYFLNFMETRTSLSHQIRQGR